MALQYLAAHTDFEAPRPRPRALAGAARGPANLKFIIITGSHTAPKAHIHGAEVRGDSGHARRCRQMQGSDQSRQCAEEFKLCVLAPPEFQIQPVYRAFPSLCRWGSVSMCGQVDRRDTGPH